MKRDLTNIIGYIYKITSPHNDIYIGQTINIRKRKYSYKKEQFKKQTKLWNNCSFYNWNPSDNFEVIDECLCGTDKIFLNEREIYWISFYDSFRNGLNCTEGGKGQIGRIWTEEQKEAQSKLILGMYERNEIPIVKVVGRKLSEESKIKISKSGKGHKAWNKGKETPDDVKEKISNSVKGEKNGFYGKKHTIETLEKMKESKVGKIHSLETRKKMSESQKKRSSKSKYPRRNKPVLQFDIDGNLINRYDSIREASEKTGCSSAKIIDVCKGNREHIKNFIWRYEK